MAGVKELSSGNSRTTWSWDVSLWRQIKNIHRQYTCNTDC